MKYHKRNDAVLLLEDGTLFKGKAIGAVGTTSGEIAFNTSMTGYQEIFTDPSYYGQILVMTVAHIGNYGVASDEIESDKVQIRGLVCKKFSESFSRPRSGKSLQEYFVEQGTVGISDIDTRALVRYIRQKGAMNAVISSENSNIEFLKEALAKTPNMSGLMLSDRVSTSTFYESGNPNALHKVAVLDYGVKKNILRCLTERDCRVGVFPFDTTSADILGWKPDGIMLSNGPGDPSSMPHQVQTVRELLLSDLPLFGICLGHQILALASGLKTIKMHHGHRGVNHPIINLLNGKCEVTSQNHGFVVDTHSLGNASDNVILTHRHLNDQSVAGIQLKKSNAASVQYHPESSAGPNDSRYLFEEFIERIDAYKAVTA
jgi:carbamoyl-phosphate synthase small subunit